MGVAVANAAAARNANTCDFMKPPKVGVEKFIQARFTPSPKIAVKALIFQ